MPTNLHPASRPEKLLDIYQGYNKCFQYSIDSIYQLAKTIRRGWHLEDGWYTLIYLFNPAGSSIGERRGGSAWSSLGDTQLPICLFSVSVSAHRGSASVATVEDVWIRIEELGSCVAGVPKLAPDVTGTVSDFEVAEAVVTTAAFGDSM
ncbi:uncharacterized protein PG986_013384 [Apiospora aurea]|uniref:Uncharacterized protein n=1 Tax=Apiospora aurea TaxID=335848 RepID=A0ABR1PVE8_9PEZI